MANLAEFKDRKGSSRRRLDELKEGL